MPLLSRDTDGITLATLDKLNVEQSREQNRANLDSLGGIPKLITLLGTNLDLGLSYKKVEEMREKFGTNKFTESPMKSFFQMVLDSFKDLTLIILSVASVVSLSVGLYEDPKNGWIEGTAILVTVVLVSMVTAANDYSKELQFRSLEKSSQGADKTSVLRNGDMTILNPSELVVGDIVVLQVSVLPIYLLYIIYITTSLYTYLLTSVCICA